MTISSPSGCPTVIRTSAVNGQAPRGVPNSIFALAPRETNCSVGTCAAFTTGCSVGHCFARQWQRELSAQIWRTRPDDIVGVGALSVIYLVLTGIKEGGRHELGPAKERLDQVIAIEEGKHA